MKKIKFLIILFIITLLGLNLNFSNANNDNYPWGEIKEKGSGNEINYRETYLNYIRHLKYNTSTPVIVYNNNGTTITLEKYITNYFNNPNKFTFIKNSSKFYGNYVVKNLNGDNAYIGILNKNNNSLHLYFIEKNNTNSYLDIYKDKNGNIGIELRKFDGLSTLILEKNINFDSNMLSLLNENLSASYISGLFGKEDQITLGELLQNNIFDKRKFKLSINGLDISSALITDDGKIIGIPYYDTNKQEQHYYIIEGGSDKKFIDYITNASGEVSAIKYNFDSNILNIKISYISGEYLTEVPRGIVDNDILSLSDTSTYDNNNNLLNDDFGNYILVKNITDNGFKNYLLNSDFNITESSKYYYNYGNIGAKVIQIEDGKLYIINIEGNLVLLNNLTDYSIPDNVETPVQVGLTIDEDQIATANYDILSPPVCNTTESKKNIKILFVTDYYDTENISDYNDTEGKPLKELPLASNFIEMLKTDYVFSNLEQISYNYRNVTMEQMKTGIFPFNTINYDVVVYMINTQYH